MAVCKEPVAGGVVVLDDRGVVIEDEVSAEVEVGVEVEVEVEVGVKAGVEVEVDAEPVDVELDVGTKAELRVVVAWVTNVEWTRTVVVNESKEEDTDDDATDAVDVTVLVTVDDATTVASASDVGLERDETLSEVSILPPMACVASAFGHSICVPFPAMNRPIKLSAA